MRQAIERRRAIRGDPRERQRDRHSAAAGRWFVVWILAHGIAFLYAVALLVFVAAGPKMDELAWLAGVLGIMELGTIVFPLVSITGGIAFVAMIWHLIRK